MKSLLLLFISFLAISLNANPGIEPSNEEAFSRLKSVLAHQTGPYNERRIQRIGNKTIQFEAFVSLEADAKISATILSDFKNIPHWAIKNINHKPGGGSYYVKVQELKSNTQDPTLLEGLFSIEIPMFKASLRGLFKMSSVEKEDILTIRGRMVPDQNSILESAEAMLKSFPSEKSSRYRWLYVYSTVVLKHWLLYEAFPERLLKRESGERIQIVLDNYQSEEDAFMLKQSLPSKGKKIP